MSRAAGRLCRTHEGQRTMSDRKIVWVLLLVGIMEPTVDRLSADCSWTAKAPMPMARMGLSTSAVNGRIYAIGGASSLTGTYYALVEEYDPATDTWIRKTNMPTARNGLAAAVVQDRIYVVGGEPSAQASLTTLEVYDPATDIWATKADMPTPRTFHCACAVEGKVYVLGGVTAGIPGAERNPPNLDVYDPMTDTWTTQGELPTPRACAAACVVDGQIYLIGGVIGSLHEAPLRIVERYEPATDTWTRKADMPTARMNLVTVVLDGKIHALGGGTWNSSIYSKVEMYDPDTDTWTQGASMPVARHGFGASAVNGKIYAIGGTQEWYPGQGISAVHEHDPTPNVSLTLRNSRLYLSWRGVLQSSRTLSSPDWVDITPPPRRCPWVIGPTQDARTTFYRARSD
jgi:N-acetylneuraminic acid mutarotase